MDFNLHIDIGEASKTWLGSDVIDIQNWKFCSDSSVDDRFIVEIKCESLELVMENGVRHYQSHLSSYSFPFQFLAVNMAI